MTVNVLGLITINNKYVLEVDGNPELAPGLASPVASLAMYDDGTLGHLYLKTGAADTAWMEVAYPEGGIWLTAGNTLTGAGATAPNEFFGSNNDFDVVYKRNALEQFRIANGAILVGLATSLGGRLQVAAANLGDEVFKQISPNGGSGAQVIKVTRQYKLQTTDATPGVIASLAIPATTRVKANFDVGCNQFGGSAGAAGDGASWERTIAAKALVAGNAILTKVQTDFTEKDVKAFDVGFAVNTTNINLSVTGGLNRNLAWSAHSEIMIFKD